MFAKQARRRVDALFHALWANDDDANHALSDRVLEGAHTWVEQGIEDPAEAESPIHEPV